MSLKLKTMTLHVVIAGCMSMAFYAQADVKIGVAGPFTGPNATYGAQYWKGASQAVADINAAGGIKGEKIVLVQGDDACEPKQAVAVANRLVDEAKVSAVVGHFCSSSTMPASEVYDEAGILTITPGSTNPQITERGMKDLFRMCGRDDQQGAIAANYMLDVLKAKKIAVIHDKDTYGQGLADATRAALAKRGTKEVLYEGLSRGEKDFNALVTKIGAPCRTWSTLAAAIRKRARWCARCASRGCRPNSSPATVSSPRNWSRPPAGRSSPTAC